MKIDLNIDIKIDGKRPLQRPTGWSLIARGNPSLRKSDETQFECDPNS